MNLIFLDTQQKHVCLSNNDSRSRHIREVLKLSAGDQFHAGVWRGPRALATIERDSDAGLELSVCWETSPPEPMPVHLLIGLPRPQAAKRILREATTLGVSSLTFFVPEKGEPAYRNSKVWDDASVRQLLTEGAEQACSTWVPHVFHTESLAQALDSIKTSSRVALDLYETDAGSLAQCPIEAPLSLLIGGERGWSANERTLLRDASCSLAHMGDRALKTDAACIAATAVALARLDTWHAHQPVKV